MPYRLPPRKRSMDIRIIMYLQSMSRKKRLLLPRVCENDVGHETIDVTFATVYILISIEDNICAGLSHLERTKGGVEKSV